MPDATITVANVERVSGVAAKTVEAFQYPLRVE